MYPEGEVFAAHYTAEPYSGVMPSATRKRATML